MVIGETWYLNDWFNMPDTNMLTFDGGDTGTFETSIDFTSNDENFSVLKITRDVIPWQGQPFTLREDNISPIEPPIGPPDDILVTVINMYYDDTSIAYYYAGGYFLEEYRTITLSEPATGELLAFLEANAERAID